MPGIFKACRVQRLLAQASRQRHFGAKSCLTTNLLCNTTISLHHLPQAARRPGQLTSDFYTNVNNILIISPVIRFERCRFQDYSDRLEQASPILIITPPEGWLRLRQRQCPSRTDCYIWPRLYSKQFALTSVSEASILTYANVDLAGLWGI